MKQDNLTFSEEPIRKLSPWRVGMALIMLAGAAYGVFLSWHNWQDTRIKAASKPWFAAYVDATSTPFYAFEQLGATPTNNAILSFIVADQTDGCKPTWGTAYNLDQANSVLDLDRRIARLRQQGGEIAISFGGLKNNELANSCSDPQKLLNAYKSVIDRYSVNTIDLDLEGNGLVDTEASKRRVTVLANLQKKQRADKKSLAIWLTLPVSPQGLTKEGTDAVALMLANGVDLAGVNVMTMDYANSKKDTDTMDQASQKALIETHRQLGILYNQAGINLSSTTLWSKIGATPMIGQNDSADEIFSLEDAAKFNQFVNSQGTGRMSIWSSNRDIQCGDNYADLKIVSDSCSGVKQHKLNFSEILSQGFDGNLYQNAEVVTRADAAATVQQDDPKISPYQIWSPGARYLEGTKVVWHKNVYQAKWWTEGDLPDNPVLQSSQTPWQLIGPVLPGEKPIPQPTLKPGTYQVWSGDIEYNAGQRVLFNGIPYQAKWWTKGDSPAAASSNPDSSPWTPLTQAQITEL